MEEYKITIKKLWTHFKTVVKHKHYVFRYCCMAGILWRGIVHDLSKFSPTEFFASAKYTTGKRSPIEVQKEVEGVSFAWMHHKAHNRHHYVYWGDNFDDGGMMTRMPKVETIEMICDYLGAGKAYNPKGFTFTDEYNWWQKKRKEQAMHPANMKFVDRVLIELRNRECKAKDKKHINVKPILNWKYLSDLYDDIAKNCNYKEQVILEPVKFRNEFFRRLDEYKGDKKGTLSPDEVKILYSRVIGDLTLDLSKISTSLESDKEE